MSHTEVIRRLLTFSQYQTARSNVFPSIDSLRWFVRHNRPALLEQGAILAPTGRHLIDPLAFDAVLLATGRARAAVDDISEDVE